MTAPKRKRAPGGGRKRTIGTTKVTVSVGDEHLAYLRTVDGNRSAAIRRVIERDMQREQKQEVGE